MQIDRVGMLGAGTMGSGISMALAAHGFQVSLFDKTASAAEGAKSAAGKFFARNVDKGRMSNADADAAVGRIQTTSDLASFADCDLVIEAVFEDFDLKAAIFKELSTIVRADALVATNTSCLRVSDLAGHMSHPARFLGLHYFSPAAINPVVEVVQGDATDASVIEQALAFTKAHGKRPITCKDSFGFAINRFFCPYTNEAARLVDENVASTADIDAVAKDALGAAAGPFLVMNLIKPRINLHAIRNMVPLGPFYGPAKSMTERGEADQSWDIGEPTSLEAATYGVVADRLRAGAFLPVLQALDEEVARPVDFDAGATNALKLGKPPCALMDELGRDEVERIIQPVLETWSLPMPASISRVGNLL